VLSVTSYLSKCCNAYIVKLAKAIALVGLIFIFLGFLFVFIPASQEVWEHKKELLSSGKLTVYSWMIKQTLPITYPLLMDPENYRNITIRGVVEGTGPFDLLIDPYVNSTHKTKFEFSFTPTPQEVTHGLQMIIVDKAMKRMEDTFILETIELPGFMKNMYRVITPLFAPKIKVPVVISGRIEETGKQPINVYLMDKENFEKWRAGLPYNVYFAGRATSSYNVNITIPSEKCDQEVYFVLERIGEASFQAPQLKVFTSLKKAYEEPADIEISYRVEMEWDEKTYAHVLGGLVVGGSLFFFGFLLLIVAALVRFIFKK